MRRTHAAYAGRTKMDGVAQDKKFAFRLPHGATLLSVAPERRPAGEADGDQATRPT